MDFEKHFLDGIHLDTAGNEFIARYIGDYVTDSI